MLKGKGRADAASLSDPCARAGLRRPLYWPQPFLRRGAEALAKLLREHKGGDCVVMAAAVLRGALPDREALQELTRETEPARDSATRRDGMVTAAEPAEMHA